MSTQTLSQRRARHALGRINERKQTEPKTYGNYVSHSQSLPAAILMNGLGQACATLLAKSEDHRLLYDDLQSWLCGDDSSAPFRNRPNLIDAITQGDQTSYLRAQAEALSYLVWLKKFANAYLQHGKPE
jgi:CRISPR-associated protein Cmr5